MEKPSWEEFKALYLEAGWFDHDRTKTLRAMRHLWQSLPPADFNSLPRPLVIFAPSPVILGELYPWYQLASGEGENGVFIYLSPELEQKPQAEVDNTVAHEFAHAILHPYSTSMSHDLIIEREADTLIESWGFKPVSTKYPDDPGRTP
jgi:hypothetical protein